MEYVNVFLYYGGKWDELNNYNDYSVSGILVPMECTYSKLVEMIVEELNWDPTKDAVSLQYQVNKNMPPIKIYNDHSISFYLELKKKDQDVTKYPLCVDVGPVSQGNIFFESYVDCFCILLLLSLHYFFFHSPLIFSGLQLMLMFFRLNN